MVTFRIDGAKELEAALNALSLRMAKTVMREALIDGAEQIRNVAARMAPREPGAPDLADSLNVGTVRARTGTGEVAVGIGPESRSFRYDYFQEFGTEHHRAQPFYRPALDLEGPKALQTIEKAVWRECAARGVQRSTTANVTPSGPGRVL